MVDYHALKSWPFGTIKHRYEARDTMLYALGCGMGHDPMDRRQLRFVYDQGLVAMPSMAAVIGTPGSWWRLPGTGVAWEHVLHAEQDLRLYRPLPAAATMTAGNRVTHLHDRGRERGAVAGLTREIHDSAGALVARASRIEILRLDGGFSAQAGTHDEAPPRLPGMPADPGPADKQVCLPIIPQAALVYRLSGDPNPLHADPDVARIAGFARPIFHGLGSFGMAAHAVLRACCNYEPERLRRLAVRFSAPIYPGETLRFHLWHERGGTARFCADAIDRSTRVLDRGIAEFS
ncbi:MaoC family dehydratase [Bordetella sp. BOR01]|uniref:MaoC family dehydratase n=1 Tax=Bordetella sp. BOR01 TaxID=2854779 RepID=UPI001C44DDAD|nr:MaoC family dehydratase [Bordetella sp. BOR01]MBV7484873.1 3-alpha,7-alpha,12-alpha-trihydroxy-5-beta-cholest-24-enoyl-CoA hydratase [Bordetella sp. BOR01]